MYKKAMLVLADGSVFHGVSIGAEGHCVGEVVFNTAMTGYQEMMTDPSYARQILTLTYPHIGNTGINQEDIESSKIQVAGLVVRDAALTASNWRSQQSLQDYLREQQIIAIADIDTRRLTRIIREQGAQSGCIYVGEEVQQAIGLARKFPGLQGMDLAKEVSTQQFYDWQQGVWQLGKGYDESINPNEALHIVAYDFGVKQNILRLLKQQDCRLTVVPAQTSAETVLALKPDGVFLSNGPGDPEPCDYAIHAIQALLNHNMPLFGICLGHQLLALACGAKTVKMKFGHHGANHPVQNLATCEVMITSQNHGFAVDETSLPVTLRATYRSLFDDSLQGIVHTQKPAFSFQGHPEASPGPHDLHPLFQQFFQLIRDNNAKTN